MGTVSQKRVLSQGGRYETVSGKGEKMAAQTAMLLDPAGTERNGSQRREVAGALREGPAERTRDRPAKESFPETGGRKL